MSHAPYSASSLSCQKYSKGKPKRDIIFYLTYDCMHRVYSSILIYTIAIDLAVEADVFPNLKFSIALHTKATWYRVPKSNISEK